MLFIIAFKTNGKGITNDRRAAYNNRLNDGMPSLANSTTVCNDTRKKGAFGPLLARSGSLADIFAL